MNKYLAIACIGAAFCTSSTAGGAEPSGGLVASCEQKQEVDLSCILLSAHQTLSMLTDRGHWTEGAIELSYAYMAIGRDADATRLLDAAVLRQEDNDDALAKLTFEIAAAKAYINAGEKEISAVMSNTALSKALLLDNSAKKWDTVGKLAATLAATGDPVEALAKVDAMPQETEAEAAYKARSYREIAAALAKMKLYDEAVAVLGQMTMGLPYYRSTARTDIAWTMVKSGGSDVAAIEQLLSEAAKLARTFKNGYFMGGALREVGEVYALMGRNDEALLYFKEAVEAAQTAPSTQEQARAVSRVATGLSDHGLMKEASEALGISLSLAATMEPSGIQNWSYYEIVGSLGFAGDFERAESFLAPLPESGFGSATSLKGVTQRDVAWGMARNGKYHQAVKYAAGINTARERLQAYARIIRVIADPEMVALPRYL